MKHIGGFEYKPMKVNFTKPSVYGEILTALELLKPLEVSPVKREQYQAALKTLQEIAEFEYNSEKDE